MPDTTPTAPAEDRVRCSCGFDPAAEKNHRPWCKTWPDNQPHPAVTVLESPDPAPGAEIPCSLAVCRKPHGPHDWEPQPDMTPVHCPGTAAVAVYTGRQQLPTNATTRTVTVPIPTTPDQAGGHTVRGGTFLHGGPAAGCTLPGCRPGDQDAPTPADPALAERVTRAVDECRTLTPEALAAAVLAELAPELAELLDYRNRITWETTCAGCAGILDSAYEETARREEAEAALATIRKRASEWAALQPADLVLADAGRCLLALIPTKPDTPPAAPEDTP